MRSRAAIDMILILLIYGIYLALILLLSSNGVLESFNVGSTNRQQAATLSDDFTNSCMIVLAVSLACMLAWYVLGEWGIKPHRAKPGTYWFTWLALLIIVGIAGVVAYMLGPQPDENAYILAMFYLGEGLLFFYLASVFCSPVNAKYLIPPSKLVRHW
jgi:hypothetical protein